MRFTPQCRALDWLIARPVAHRGLHDPVRGIIENTSSAFAAALQHNYAIECDLQITSDGEAVVFHDETLDRLCTSQGLVKSKTAHEICSTISFKACRDRIQRFDELLAQVAGRVTLVVELKSHWDGDRRLAQRALQVLETYAGPYALMSFDPDLVEALAELSPKTIRGITADRATDDYYQALPLQRRIEMRRFDHLPRTKPHFVSFNFGELPFQPVQEIRAAGHPILTWTLKNQADAARAKRFSDQITFENYLA
jgi:glycerophosphoryl diester phosphodiesterase